MARFDNTLTTLVRCWYIRIWPAFHISVWVLVLMLSMSSAMLVLFNLLILTAKIDVKYLELEKLK